MLKFIFSLLFSFFCCSRISKHLMLKFINLFWACRLQVSLFQNILCWSLSQSSNKRGVLLPISKHLMLKFINEPDEQRYYRTEFQNILCWSLSPHFLVTFISFYLFSPSFFLISIIFTKHQPIFFFLSNISQIPRLYNTFSTFFFFSPGKYFYNSQSGMGCSSDVFTTENAWS